jgi:hypothetical protein
MKRRAIGVLGGIAILVVASAAAPATSGTNLASGSLSLRAELRLVSNLGACPPGVTAFACAARTGTGPVSGLGSVSEAYAWAADVGPPSCAAGFGKALGSVVRFVVAGKGEIHFTLAEGVQCVDQEAVRTQTQTFTITGGTAAYAGASGSGSVERLI